jgi:RNA polymerase sigma-70 factor (ECF subfamily)
MRFETTRWSVVLAAGRGDTTGREALETLCQAYWYPVYAFIRRQMRDAEEARDLTQAFFLSIIERGDLGRVRRERGRFRSFLLAAARHFVSNDRAGRRTLKRGGHITFEPLAFDAAEQRYQREPADHQTPETVFARQWALLLLEQTIADVRAEFVRHGTIEEFERLKPMLTGERPEGGYGALARDLNKTEGAVKVAVHRLKKQFQMRLRERIAETVSEPGQIDEELMCLTEALFDRAL